MKIRFTNHNQDLTAEKIIRCEVESGAIFHVMLVPDEVEVYATTDKIKCYQVDGKEITDG